MKLNGLYSKMEFGEYTIKQSYVEPKYKDLKSELLATNLIDAKTLEEGIIQKVERLMQSDAVKRLRACCYGCELYKESDPYHFGVPKGSPIQPHHLHALVAYTDFTKLSTEITESFRKLKNTESFEDVKRRNECLCWCSRFLRELVLLFGSIGRKKYENKANGIESGPFYCGMSVVLALPQFTIGLQGPTSTSKERCVAWRFAGTQGMVIKMNNEKGTTLYESFFDASWISKYGMEENERLFCGSVSRLGVQSLINAGDFFVKFP